jgi:ribose transport system permease protein
MRGAFRPAPRARPAFLLRWDLAPTLLIATAVVAADASLQSGFFSSGNLAELLVQLAPFILVAMAQTLVMLLAGLDLSIGALMSLGSTLVATHLHGGLVDVPVLAAVVLLCGVASAATGVLIAAMRLPALIVTLATSFIWAGLALYVLPQPGGNVPGSTASWFTGSTGPVPNVAILLVACFVVWSHFRRTRAGLHIYALGANTRAARASGLSPVRVYAVAHGLAGCLVGLAAVVISAQTSSGDPGIGAPFTLASFAAAVLGGVSFFGGRGKMVGAIAGAVVIGMLVNLLLYAGVSSFYEDIGEGVLLVLAVSIRLVRARFSAHTDVAPRWQVRRGALPVGG